MATKKITELGLIDEVTDGVNLVGDHAIQTYRLTALQLKNYINQQIQSQIDTINADNWVTSQRLATSLDFGSMPSISGSPIIETGNNANGNYIKFADGTMICTTARTMTYQAATYLRLTWTFPIAFSNTPVMTAQVKTLSITPTVTQVGLLQNTTASPTSGVFDLHRIANQTNFGGSDSAGLAVIAIGNWV